MKVWVYKGDRLENGEAPKIEAPNEEDKKRRGARRDDARPGRQRVRKSEGAGASEAPSTGAKRVRARKPENAAAATESAPAEAAGE